MKMKIWKECSVEHVQEVKRLSKNQPIIHPLNSCSYYCTLIKPTSPHPDATLTQFISGGNKSLVVR